MSRHCGARHECNQSWNHACRLRSTSFCAIQLHVDVQTRTEEDRSGQYHYWLYGCRWWLYLSRQVWIRVVSLHTFLYFFRNSHLVIVFLCFRLSLLWLLRLMMAIHRGGSRTISDRIQVAPSDFRSPRAERNRRSVLWKPTDEAKKQIQPYRVFPTTWKGKRPLGDILDIWSFRLQVYAGRESGTHMLLVEFTILSFYIFLYIIPYMRRLDLVTTDRWAVKRFLHPTSNKNLTYSPHSRVILFDMVNRWGRKIFGFSFSHICGTMLLQISNNVDGFGWNIMRELQKLQPLYQLTN